MPSELATRVAGFDPLCSALDIVEMAEEAGESVEAVAAVYFALGDRLQLHWLRDQIEALPRDNRWHTLARAALRDDLYAQERAATADVLRVSAPGDAPDARIAVLGYTQRRGGAADNAVDRRRQSRWNARTGNSVRGAAREPQPHPDCRRFAATTLIPSVTDWDVSRRHLTVPSGSVPCLWRRRIGLCVGSHCVLAAARIAQLGRLDAIAPVRQLAKWTLVRLAGRRTWGPALVAAAAAWLPVG